jgi:hypothetical protein
MPTVSDTTRNASWLSSIIFDETTATSGGLSFQNSRSKPCTLSTHPPTNFTRINAIFLVFLKKTFKSLMLLINQLICKS